MSPLRRLRHRVWPVAIHECVHCHHPGYGHDGVDHRTHPISHVRIVPPPSSSQKTKDQT